MMFPHRLAQGLLFVYATKCVWAADYVVDPVQLPTPPYPGWAHAHFVWLHAGSDSNQTKIIELVSAYQAHGIPVGGINIDSGWATSFNNFEVDTSKFPSFKQLVDELHSQDIRVIVWATSMIDTDNPDYDMAKKNKYFITGPAGLEVPIKWWHGKGQLLDYTNPQALAFWHSRMDRVLSLGIDGFKCDGTDPFILEYGTLAQGYSGKVSRREYSDLYYRDFLHYCNTVKNTTDPADRCLIWSRPVDCFVHDKLNAGCLDFSPKDVMFSGWVGDDDPTWAGLESCLSKVLLSAEHGYLNFGCDIGGYRSGPGPYGREKDLFIRWAQIMAFLPLMENGGAGEHRPWGYDTETLNIYRTYAVQHTQLKPFFHSVGARAFAANSSSIAPAEHSALPRVPGHARYAFVVGQDILVAPVVRNDSTTEVVFPAGLWLSWWDPSQVVKGGEKRQLVAPLNQLPVFVRAGAIIPQIMKDGSTLQVGIFKPSGTSSFDVYDEQPGGVAVKYTYDEPTAKLTVQISATAHPCVVMVVGASLENGAVVTLTGGNDTSVKHLEDCATKSTQELCFRGDGNTITIVVGQMTVGGIIEIGRR